MRLGSFDYVDRLVLVLFLALQVRLTSIYMPEVVTGLGYLILFFLVWPLARQALNYAADWSSKQWRSWRGTA